jgi:hypothetical protein
MSEQAGADFDLDESHALLPAQQPFPNHGARFPGEVIKQRRTFRIGLQFAPLAACIAMPPVLGTLLNPDFLHVRSLQLLALVAVIIAGTGIYLLCHHLSRNSHRLHLVKFWVCIAANLAVIIAVAGASVRAYLLGHAPADVSAASNEQ